MISDHDVRVTIDYSYTLLHTVKHAGSYLLGPLEEVLLWAELSSPGTALSFSNLGKNAAAYCSNSVALLASN